MPNNHENKALNKALRSFKNVELNYVHALEKRGLKFAPRGSHEQRVEELKQELRSKCSSKKCESNTFVSHKDERTSCINSAFNSDGKSNLDSTPDACSTSSLSMVQDSCNTNSSGVVNFRNACASISIGWLSKACVECTGFGGSQTFSTTLKCHRDCYFCFNHNLKNYELFFDAGCPWEQELQDCYNGNKGNLAAMAVSGGEPLCVLDDSIALIKRACELFPGVHTRMYTSGDLLDASAARALHDAGLKEIRFSIKLEDSVETQQHVIENMKMAGRYIEDVMVEMPIIPLLDSGEYSKQTMQNLMLQFQDAGIRGMNLLEFCFPFHNWEEFERRGFLLKNPPFPVMCDYSYSGGLAVAGSEELALELMCWAMDAGITYGLHYCSLENKHRSEMLQANAGAEKVHPIFDFDTGDYFIKCAKVFGDDCKDASEILKSAGCTCAIHDGEENSLAFPRKYLNALSQKNNKLTLTESIYTMVDEGDEHFLREVGLKVLNNKSAT